MSLKQTRGAAALALVVGILGSSNSIAVLPAPVADEAQAVKPAWTPLGLSKTPVTVVVQVAGASVAEQQGAAGRRFTREEKDRAKEQLGTQHDALRPQIEAMGGQVLAHYRAAYNGLKVRIDSNRVPELAALPGVVAVRPVQLFRRQNTHGIPFIGAPTVWQNLGVHGEGVKIAIIDTGIDYTHANFGGPGTPAAYFLAQASETQPADPRWFGPNAPRIKGGFDFVGDSYNPDSTAPTYQPVPHPDPNPLDCEGHGSHVAGTAAGSGVTADGAMYSGPYDAATLSNPATFVVGPGVAPKADLYAVRIFGCLGPTELVLEGIDWAVDNDMDVINMSLGGVFGSKDDPTSAAATNAAKAGIIVVAAAGNDGPNPYIVSAPATGEGAIAVAANDPTPSFPAATISFTGAGGALSIPAINANGYALPPSRSYTIKVLTGANQLGCSVAAFGGPLPPDTIAVVNRG